MNEQANQAGRDQERTKKPGLFRRFAGRMALRMMKHCPCFKMMERTTDENGQEVDWDEMMARMTSKDGEGGFCAEMMAACCGGRENSESPSEETCCG